jgi:hypothetical protein
MHLPLLQLLASLQLLLLPAAATAAADDRKLGLCCMGCNETQYSSLGNVTSWAYRYSLWVDDPGATRWLVDNKVEFVPHLAHHHVPLPWGGACEAFESNRKGKAPAPLCTDGMLDQAIAFAKGQGLTVRYLMGWNEAYDKGNAKAGKKHIDPADAAEYWRTHVQGMAARNNLTLVSPTTGVEKKKLEWLGDMIIACWANRNNPSPEEGCEVESIAAFSVHDYKCAEPYWRENYGNRGVFQTKLAAHISKGDSSGGKDWEEYVNTRLIWVTETNCNGDTGFPPTAPVSAAEQVRMTCQCEKATRQFLMRRNDPLPRQARAKHEDFKSTDGVVCVFLVVCKNIRAARDWRVRQVREMFARLDRSTGDNGDDTTSQLVEHVAEQPNWESRDSRRYAGRCVRHSVAAG